MQHLDHEAWRRVALFAFAAGNKAFQNDLLTKVFKTLPAKLPKPSAAKKKLQANEQQARARAVFALQCRGQALQCDEDVKEKLNGLAIQLVPPRNLTDASWLAAAGNVVVPHLKYARRAASAQVACARALKLIGTPESLQTLEAYRADGRPSVQKELLGAIALDPSLVYELNLTQRRISDLRPLASLVKLRSLDLFATQVADLTPLVLKQARFSRLLGKFC